MPNLAKMKALLEDAKAAYKAQFTSGFYHSSGSPNIKAFDPLKNTDPMKLETPGVTFVTRDTDFAESFLPGSNRGGYKTGATMYPVKVNLGKHWHPGQPESQQVVEDYLNKMYPHETNPQDLVDIKKDMLKAKWEDIENPNFLQHLRDTGHDTFHVMEGGVPNVGVLKPENIRGKFAAFNPEDAASPDFMKAEGGSVEGYAGGGTINAALKLAKELAPHFNLEAIRNMPVSSAAKQTPIANVFKMLSAEEVSPAIKKQIFDQYVAKMPDVVRKSGATNYDELTQAAYHQMGKETRHQYEALRNSGVNIDFDPTGAKSYKNSQAMLDDALGKKHLDVFSGGEPHELLGDTNNMFRATHDYFGHGTTGASFGPKGEEAAYGAHAQMYSPLGKMAAAAETRGQNSLVNYGGMNDELIAKMAQARASGASPEELKALGDQWQYAPQKALILPPEQADLNYPGYAGGGKIEALKQLAHAVTVPFTHFSPKADLTALDPKKYGTGMKGAEAPRLANAPDIAPRSYFYHGDSIVPESGVGANKYSGVSQNSYPISKDPAGFYDQARTNDPYLMEMGIRQHSPEHTINNMERLIRDAGYDSYHTDTGTGVLFNNTPVTPVK